jgi:hypothetical protein
MRSHSKTAVTWAERWFQCSVHREEAASLFDGIRSLCSAELGDPDPESTLGEVLASVGRSALIQTGGPQNLEVRHLVQRAVQDHIVRAPLLGPAAKGCTWDVGTLPVRFLRAIVDERVRHRGGCSCAG